MPHVYLVCFAAAAAIDTIPLFAPPSWTALLFLLVRFHLDPLTTTVVGVSGATTGRLILTTYIHKLSSEVLSRHEDHNLEYLGKKLAQRGLSCFAFVFVYCITPLSTTALFTAAGVAQVKRRETLPPFFLGKLISYGIILWAGAEFAGDIRELFAGQLSLKTVVVAAIGFAMIFGLLFIDWKALLHEHRLRLEAGVLRRRQRAPAPYHYPARLASLALLLLAAPLCAAPDELFDGALSKLAPRPVVVPAGVNPMLYDKAFRANGAIEAENIPEARRQAEDTGVRWDTEIFGGLGNIGLPNPINLRGGGGQGAGDPGVAPQNNGLPGGRAPYFAARVARWKNQNAWELEGINTYTGAAKAAQPDTDLLRGYDHFLVNRAYALWGFIMRVGAGVVVTHPQPTEAQVAEHSSGSYYFSGLGSQAAIQKRVYISDHAFTSLEGKVTGDAPRTHNPQDTVTPAPITANGVVGIGLEF